MPYRLPIALPLIAGLLAAPALAQDLPPCEMRAETEVDGTVTGVVELHAVRVGMDSEATLEGRYTLVLPAVSRADESAPETIEVQVTHMEVGTPAYGGTGFRYVIVTAPGILGTSDKGPQPTVELKSFQVPLGVRPVSTEGNVLFTTSNATMGQPATADLVMAMDLDKRLSRPREGVDVQIVLRDKAGKQLAEYLLPGSTLRAMKDALQSGYGVLQPGVEAGQCAVNVTLTGY